MARRRSMARRTRRAGGSFGRAVRRRSSKSNLMAVGKKAAIGTAAGIAVTIGLGLLGNRLGNQGIVEAGERVGNIAASHFGGTPGVAGFQIVDAILTRTVPGLSQGGIGQLQEAYL